MADSVADGVAESGGGENAIASSAGESGDDGAGNGNEHQDGLHHIPEHFPELSEYIINIVSSKVGEHTVLGATATDYSVCLTAASRGRGHCTAELPCLGRCISYWDPLGRQ